MDPTQTNRPSTGQKATATMTITITVEALNDLLDEARRTGAAAEYALQTQVNPGRDCIDYLKATEAYGNQEAKMAKAYGEALASVVN